MTADRLIHALRWWLEDPSDVVDYDAWVEEGIALARAALANQAPAEGDAAVGLPVWLSERLSDAEMRDLRACVDRQIAGASKLQPKGAEDQAAHDNALYERGRQDGIRQARQIAGRQAPTPAQAPAYLACPETGEAFEADIVAGWPAPNRARMTLKLYTQASAVEDGRRQGIKEAAKVAEEMPEEAGPHAYAYAIRALASKPPAQPMEGA